MISRKSETFFKLLRKKIHTTASVSEVQEVQIKNIPKKTDVLVIGGGAMGSSSAYWLKQRTKNEDLKVVVIEKDPTYQKCATALSVGGIRQQFSLEENIEMSMFGAEFLKNLRTRFGTDADVNFQQYGYLVLANTKGAQLLKNNYMLQEKLGARHVLLDKDGLNKRFPWLNVEDVELASLGLDTEGWFDPWSLLQVLRRGAIESGAQYISAEAAEFIFTGERDSGSGSPTGLNALVIKLPNGELKTIQFSNCLIAAGCESGDVARLAKIGESSGLLSVELPVEKRKRFVFHFRCEKNEPQFGTPMVIDYTGAYFRREAGAFIGGVSPTQEEEPATDNMEVDYSYFDNKLWPLLANRVPAFDAIKVFNAWSGFYEYNTFDQNGVIGRHPHYSNLYIASGFSGHGIQQSPAVGRAISELIIDGRYKSIDLTRLGFERLIDKIPMIEVGII